MVSAGAGSHGSAPACLLPAQGASLPRGRRFREAGNSGRLLLRSLLLPSRTNFAIGQSAARECIDHPPGDRDSRYRPPFRPPPHDVLRVADDARSSATRHRLSQTHRMARRKSRHPVPIVVCWCRRPDCSLKIYACSRNRARSIGEKRAFRPQFAAPDFLRDRARRVRFQLRLGARGDSRPAASSRA